MSVCGESGGRVARVWLQGGLLGQGRRERNAAGGNIVGNDV